MILLFTNKEDVHPNRVIPILTEWGVPVFRFNTECLLTDYSFGWSMTGGVSDFFLRNVRNGLEIRGSQVAAVWERRAQIPNTLPLLHDNQEINKHTLDEAHGFLSFIRYYLKDVPSIGAIVEDRFAESKMLQLKVAASLGMRVPDTCFSNNADDVRAFARSHSVLSLKPISESSVYVDDEHEYVFYCQKVSAQQVLALPDLALSQSVNYLQEYVPKDYELRLTVFGQDVIACRIDSQAQSDSTGKVDWRQGFDHNIAQSIVDVPSDIKAFCFNYLNALGLRMGCFDFIVTPSGEYVFLECNPNGQWLWLELDTGFDYSRVLARNLALLAGVSVE